MTARVGGGHPENPLQQARIKAGVSQEKIAEELSRDIRTIQRYEAGEQFPDWNELLKMKVRYSRRKKDDGNRQQRTIDI